MPVSGIVLSAAGDAASVPVGGTLELSAAVSPSDATDSSVLWSVTDGSGSASIDQSGVLTGVSSGTVSAVATACDGSGVSGTLEIIILEPAPDGSAEAPSGGNPEEPSGGTIEEPPLTDPVPAESIAVTDASETYAVAVLGTLQLQASVLPAEAAESPVVWTVEPGISEPAGQATIDENGLLTGVSEGYVSVVASARDNAAVRGALEIAVIDLQAVSTLGLDDATVSVSAPEGVTAVAVTKTVQLSAAITPADPAKSVVWQITAGADFASINETGLLSGIAAGEVTVRASLADDSTVYDELVLHVVPKYDYVLVVNTNPDPTSALQSTGTLVFEGGSGALQHLPSPDAQTYPAGTDRQSSSSQSGYSAGERKTIGYASYICLGSSDHCYVWMEESLYQAYEAANMTDTAAAEMMAVYEGRPYQALNTLARGAIPSMDGTGKLSILLEQLQDSTGYFAGEDGITAIHVKTPAAANYKYGALSTFAGLLAHEGQHALFQHFVCGDDAAKEQPLRWLNEGLSVAAMDWVWGGDGNGNSGWLSTVSNNTRIRSGESLAYANYRSDSGLDYGLPYLFVRYLSDQAERKYNPLQTMAVFYQQSLTGSPSAYLNAVIGSLGLTGSANFTDALKNFYVAAVSQDGSGVHGFYGDPVVKLRMTYPLFDGADGETYRLPGTGAIILRTKDGVFSEPAAHGADIQFVPFNEGDAASAWGGGGTADSPYLVSGASILSAISLNPSGYFKLTENITVDPNFITIDHFSGTLNGDGHAIRGLNKPLVSDNTGLICNLNVGLAIEGDYSGYVGGVACINNGTIRNVNVSGRFTARLSGTKPYGYPAAGAIAGFNGTAGDIHECESDTVMQFTALPANNVYLGQIAGENNSGKIYDCIAKGSISAAQTNSGAFLLYAGGLSGYMKSHFFTASLKHSYSLTTFSVQASGSGNTSAVGRLVGCAENASDRSYKNVVESCYGLDSGSIPAAGLSPDEVIGSLSNETCLKTEQAMQDPATYADWDPAVWSFPTGGVPTLGGGGSGTGAASSATVSNAKTEYYVGEALVITGAKVTVGSKTADITRQMLYSVPDLDTPGTHTVYGAYDAVGFSFTVTVTQPSEADVSALTVVTPARSSYLSGQFFNANGAVLQATINGNAVSIVSGFTVDKTGQLTMSDTEVVYTYCGKTASQPISVAAKAIVAIQRVYAMTNSIFSDGETLALDGLTLRLRYSDAEEKVIRPAEFSQYGVMLLLEKGGVYTACPSGKTLRIEDNGGNLVAYVGSAVPSTLTGGVSCPVETLQVGQFASMPEQTITMHTGIAEVIDSDMVEGGSGNYQTERISGTLPAGITVLCPGDQWNERFTFSGTPQAECSVLLTYLVKDLDQNRQFRVDIRFSVVPPSNECDLIWATLGTAPNIYPCLIGENTASAVLPQGTDLTNLMLNMGISPGALWSENWSEVNGQHNFTLPVKIPVYAQTNQSRDKVEGQYKEYTFHVRVASGDALASPTGLTRTDSTVNWQAVPGADGYVVTLLKRGTDIPAYDERVISRFVTGTSFDMRSVIPQTGRYYVSVSATDSTGVHSVSRAADTVGDVYYCNLTPVRTITVSGPSSAAVGHPAAFYAAVTPANAGKTEVTWSVSNGTGAASISAAGMLTGTSAGTVTVKATAQDGTGVYGQADVTIVAASELRTVTVDVAGIRNPSQALWIDGAEYSGSNLTISGTNYSVQLMDDTATNAIVYSYNDPNETDPHKVYPTNMTVWLLEFSNDAYTATRAPSFDQLLRYAGSSIRITGNRGIRMITAISTETKQALTGSGIYGYTLLEYGTAAAWKTELQGNPLVLGRSYTKPAYAYKKGVADPVFKEGGGITQYTNGLVFSQMEKCKPELIIRSYIKLQNAANEVLTLYGAPIERSIGYIAYQNRGVFAPNTPAYAFIWDMIHYAYGNVYDAEYEG